MGLLSIMVQSGMLIPVKEDSKTKIFDNIFADIGDEQSIEQSLSTFCHTFIDLSTFTKKFAFSTTNMNTFVWNFLRFTPLHE